MNKVIQFTIPMRDRQTAKWNTNREAIEAIENATEKPRNNSMNQIHLY